jgi:hypothetical protein
MANNTHNFLNSGVNWLPLFTRTAVPGQPGSAGKLEYTFGTEPPTSFDGSFDLLAEPNEGIKQNWGRYDQVGIKRNHTEIIDDFEEMNLINESSIFINNISPFTVKVWQYVGDTFSEDGQTSTSESSENVGYWISHSNHVEPGTQQTIPWQNDRYGFQTERIYFQALDNDNVLDGFNTSELSTIEEISIAQDYSAATGNPGSVTGDNIYGIMVMAQEGIYITDLNHGGSGSDLFSTLVLTPGDDEIEDSIGLIAGEYWKRDTEIFDTFFPAYGLDATINMYREPNVTKGFIVIDTNLPDLENFVVAPNSLTNATTYSILQYTIPSSYTIDVDGTATTYNITTSNITGIIQYYTIETSGVLSGVVEGSFLTGSVVQGKDINGVLMTTTTNSSGYYEFPRAAFGEIVAKGGTNLITGEEYTDNPVIGDDNVDSVTEDLTTNSTMGGTISPVSTLLQELQKNEGYSQEEALGILVNEGQDLYDLDSSIANESKLREYLKLGLTGLQNSDTDDLADYTNFLMFSKKIAEQEQIFVDTNISGDAQKSKKKQAASNYRKSLTRFIKRKQDDNVAKFKTDYLAKAGTDSTASAIGNTPTKKDQFYLILADAVEKVDPLLSDTEKLASSKADFKVKAKEMMEETIDDQESISTSGKDYEDIALEVNEKFFKRKQAAKEEQVSRYNGNTKVNFSTRKSQNTFAITKETDGYKRTGNIIKKTGDSSTTLSSTAKTRTKFLKDDNVEKFNPISIVGDTEIKLKKSSTGRLTGLSRFEQNELARQTSTGIEVRNPNHIIVEPSANGFGAYSVAYAFHASEGITYKSRGLGNQTEVYSFAIVDQSTGKRVKTNYANDSLFRQLADAFMTLANADTLNDLTSTVVYYYLNEFALRRDSDMDGVIDSEDVFPNDPSKFEHQPFTYTIDTTLAGDNLTQRFGTGLYSHAQETAHLDLDNENVKLKIDWGEGDGWEYYGKSDSVSGRSLYNTQRYNFEHTYSAHGTYRIRVSYEDVISAYPTVLTQPVPQEIGAWVYSINSTDSAKRVTSIDSWGDMNTIRLFTAQGLYAYLENCQSWPAVDTSLITEVAAGTHEAPFVPPLASVLHTAKYLTSFNATDWNLTQGKGNKVIEIARYYNRFRDADRLETLNLNGLEYDQYSSAWPDDHGYFGSLVPNGTLVGFNDITIDQDGGNYNSAPNNNGGFQGYLKGRIHKDSTFNNVSINNATDDIWRVNPTNVSDIITDDSTYTFQQKNWIDTSGDGNKKLKVKQLPSFYLKGTDGETRTSGIDITLDLTSPNGWELNGSFLRQWQYGPNNATLAAGTKLTILGTGNWDTSKVTNWYQFMYYQPSTIILDMDISSWSFEGSPTDAINSFSLPTLTSEQYTKALIAWAASEPSYSATINLGNAQYDYSAYSAKMSLVNDYGWTITDGGIVLVDTDGDGVGDDVDLYPNDNTKTTQEISGTLQFTDLGTFDSASGIVGVSAIPFNLRQNLQYAENDASTPSSYKIYNGDDKDTADYIIWDGAAIKNSDSMLNLIDAEEVAYVQAAEFLTNATFENYFTAIGGTGTTSTDYVGSHYMWKSTNPEASTTVAGIEKVLSSTLISATGEAPTATEAWEWGMAPVELWAKEFVNFYSNNGFGEMNYVHAGQSRFRGNTDYTDISNQNLSTMTGSWIESLLHYSIMSVYGNTDLKNNIWSRGYITYSEYTGAGISGTYANPMLDSLRRISAHGIAEGDIIDRDFVGPRGTEAYTNSENISMTSTLQDIFTNQAAVDSWISTIGGASIAAKVCMMYNIIIGNGILEVARHATDKANYENVMLNGYGNIDKMKQALSYNYILLPVEQNNYLHSYPNVAPFLNGGSLYKDLNARIAVEYISKFQYVVNWMIRVNDAVPASGGSYGGVVGDDNL